MDGPLNMQDDDLRRIIAAYPGDLLQRIRQRDGDQERKFWGSLDKKALEAEFAKATEADFRKITPVWTYDPADLAKTEYSTDMLSGVRLYSATREAFLRHHREADLYTIEAFRDRSSFGRLLRVVGHWKRGDALCPPVHVLFEPENTLMKIDGHHRTTVAVLTGADRIPFYSKSVINLDGISLM